MKKHYITAGELLKDSYTLGWQVFDSGYRPDIVIGVWRGGSPVAVAVHELLQVLGVKPDHFAVRTASYTGIAERERDVKVDGLEYLAARTAINQRLLIVDDVHDTGLSLQCLVAELENLYGPRKPEIRLAVPWFKPANNRSGTTPDYHIHQSDDWLVFPHELEGLTTEELARHKPELADLLTSLAPHLDAANR